MENFNNFLNTELNTQQRKAVKHKNGSILVVAGAGSGKTRVITARIANLIMQEETHPLSILALTFTNKAAREMKERVANFIGPDIPLPFIGTFHSYSLYLLRRNKHLTAIPDFSILDEDDKKTLLKKMLKKYGLEKKIGVQQVTSYISGLKNKIKDSEDPALQVPMLKEIYHSYEKEKAAMHSLDFDDLLLEALRLFKTNKEFKDDFQQRIRHILVDEYQDTNGVQHSFLKEMALNKNNEMVIDSICGVGDADQSIYSWRGAIVKNMIKFEKDFAPVDTIKIEQNYRTVQPILTAANKVIANNKLRNEKQLWSDKKAKNRILALQCKSDYQEADSIGSFLRITQEKSPDKDRAILYRTHYQSRILEEALLQNNITYRIVGDIQFYQRKEIKDILAYLRLVINPFDKISFLRVINTPSRGLGKQFEETVMTHWDEQPLMDYNQILSDLLEQKIFTGKRAEAIESFIHIFDGLNKEHKPSLALDTIVSKTTLLTILRTSLEPQEADARIGNIKELVRAVDHFERKKDKDLTTLKGKTLEGFLEEVALIQDKQEMQQEDEACVQMMTLHAAKGLEFDTVILAGLEEGVFPSTRALSSYEALEEERRLFYVGMTRAKERLIVSCANTRNAYGELQLQTPSRFLTEIPSSLMQEVNVTSERPFRLKSIFNTWLGFKEDRPNITFFGAEIPENIRKYTEKALNDGKKSTRTTPKILTRARSKITAKSTTSFTTKPANRQSTRTNPVSTNINKNSNNPWKKNQLVEHQVFGIGMVVSSEDKGSGEFKVTVNFKNSQKKLMSKFLKQI